MLLMTSFKKVYEMIELHNNVDLKSIIESDKKFNPNYCLYKKSFVHCAIYCDNFEAFQMLINHSKFDSKALTNINWIEFALRRYSVGSNYENIRYLEEIIKNNIVLNSTYIRCCPNVSTLQKIINNIDMTNPTNVIKDSLRYGVNDDIQLFILDNLLSTKPELFTKQFVDANVLSYALNGSKIGLIELLKKYNIDTKTCNGKPCFLCPITYDKIDQNLLKYLLNEKHFYNENLIDKKWFSFVNYMYSYNNIPKQLEVIIDNIDILKPCFERVADDNYELLNLIMSDLFNGKFAKYGIHYMKNKLESFKKIIHFLLRLNLQQNVFEKLLFLDKYEGMFVHSDKKNYGFNVYNQDQRDFAKALLGCALTYHQPTAQFKKIIDFAFTNSSVEQANIETIKETYKYVSNENKEITVKKGKGKKVMNL